MAKKRKKSLTSGDMGSFEAHRHGEYRRMPTDKVGVFIMRNLTSDQLQTYHRRHQISNLQYDAGGRFYGDFYQAKIGPNYGAMDLTKVRVDQALRPDEDSIHIARERVRRALDYVGQPLSRLVVHVCGHGHTAGSWGGLGDVNRPDKDGMVALRLALSALANHYQLT